MKLCGNDCTPCCDFCIHARHEYFKNGDGSVVCGGPIGCTLHEDKEHQEIALYCGSCDDFYCFRVKEN